jgi:hypothetical protein
MPIELTCCGCRKHLRVRDEVAGKRVRCPACGATVSVPSPITEEPAVIRVKRPPPSPPIEEEEPDEPSPLEDSPKRRRKKGKKRSSSVLFYPMLSLFGIDLTPLKLIVLAVVLLVGGLSVFLYVTAPEAKVRVVDVYNLEDDLHEFTTGAPEGNLIKLLLLANYKPKALIVQEKPDGAFLMVRFKISERTLKKLVGEDYPNFVLKKKDVVLQGDGDPIYPLFMFEPVKAPNYVIRTKSRLGDGDGEKPEPLEPPVEAHQKDVAPSAENPWTHPGVLQVNPTGSSEFQGIRGMLVTYTHGRLPAKEVTITWDKDSAIWFGVKEQGTPGEIFLVDWRLTCLFPRPATTKNLKLTVLGQSLKMNYP